MQIGIDDIVHVLRQHPGKWLSSTRLANDLCGDPNQYVIVEALLDLYSEKFFITSDSKNIRSARLRDYIPPLNPMSISEMERIADAVKNYARQLEHYEIKVKNTDTGKNILDRWLHELQIDLDNDDLKLTDDTPVEFISDTSMHKNYGYISGISVDEATLYVTLDNQLSTMDCPGVLKVNRNEVYFRIAEKIKSLAEFPARFPQSDIQGEHTYSNKDSTNVASYLSNQPTPYTRFLWGPPGSGKTHCIAGFCKYLLTRSVNSRILIVAPSNVAVDAVVAELIVQFKNTINILSERLIFRYGYPKDSRIIGCVEVLGPIERDELMKSISAVHEEIRKLKGTSNVKALVAEKKSLLHQLQKKLKDATIKHIGEARIVATTIASAFMGDSPVAGRDDWENIIIDEASMINGATLVALSSLAQARCIIVGDPRQLGPIFDWNRRQNPSDDIKKWLALDPFQIAQISSGEGWSQKIRTETASMVRVLSQRRCHPTIWSLVSNLYESVEPAVDNAYLDNIAQIPPLPGYPAILLDISKGRAPETPLGQDRGHIEIEDAINYESACQSNGSSWCNPPTAMLAIDVAREMQAVKSDIKIAIITPYRGQVRLIRKWLEEERKDSKRLKDIEVGTVHSFQGGEADAVIFDIVDGPPRRNLGALLQKESEMRLVNVAVSRAKGKIVIIGHKEWLYEKMRDSHGLLWHILFGSTQPQYKECKVMPPRLDSNEFDNLTESPIEKKFYDELMQHKNILPRITLQYRIYNAANRIISRADFAFVQQKLAIYCDGTKYHLNRQQWQRDLRQRRELTMLGWKYLAFTGAEINQDIENCIAEVLRHLGRSEKQRSLPGLPFEENKPNENKGGLHAVVTHMTVEAIIEGNKLIITCELEKPTPSASGKTLVVASTRGNMKTSCMVDGKPLTIGLNAYIPK